MLKMNTDSTTFCYHFIVFIVILFLRFYSKQVGYDRAHKNYARSVTSSRTVNVTTECEFKRMSRPNVTYRFYIAVVGYYVSFVLSMQYMIQLSKYFKYLNWGCDHLWTMHIPLIIVIEKGLAQYVHIKSHPVRL